MARVEERGNQLGWLTGDPSTRAKANIILHPEMFGLFVSVRVSDVSLVFEKEPSPQSTQAPPATPDISSLVYNTVVF